MGAAWDWVGFGTDDDFTVVVNERISSSSSDVVGICVRVDQEVIRFDCEGLSVLKGAGLNLERTVDDCLTKLDSST